jgi:hypothetical protein
MDTLPSSLQVGEKMYYVLQQTAKNNRHYGHITHGTGAIVIYTADKQGVPTPVAEVNETFWHELTHAVLYQMKDKRHSDEAFVTAFSRMLSRAIDSARF